MFGERKGSGKGKSPEKARRKCPHCKNRGICTCQYQLNRAMASDKAPKPCTYMCKNGGKRVCDRTMRGGVCPCPDCP